MKWSKLALFAAGLFFGVAIDHVILALMNSPLTPYVVRWGVAGNWILGALLSNRIMVITPQKYSLTLYSTTGCKANSRDRNGL